MHALPLRGKFCWYGTYDDVCALCIRHMAYAGLDANDESKTIAVLHLYVSVLSCLPRIRGAAEAAEDGDSGAAGRQRQQRGGDMLTCTYSA